MPFHPGYQEFVLHVKRCHNTVADALANRCLDEGVGSLLWLVDGLQEVFQRLALGQRLHLVGRFDGALRSGHEGAAGLHFQVCIYDTSGATTRFKLLAESCLIDVDSAYAAELAAAGRLIKRIGDFMSSLFTGRGEPLELGIES